MKILITGGAGFIGSHVIKKFVLSYPKYEIINLDALTYAGNLENLKDIENKDNYKFIKGDIRDSKFIDNLFESERFDSVIHLAAESHVDRSIESANEFVETNVLGTVNLLSSFKNLWLKKFKNKIFYHVSTDEVYGSLGPKGLFTEDSKIDPRSPYAASKASSDLFVRAFGETYDLPFIISNCSNNYGEFHFPEKFIPLIINNILEKKEIPIYGDGNYVRDWLYVKDHANAIDLIFHKGKNKETYNIGGLNEWKNIDLVKLICEIMDKKLGKKSGDTQKLITFIKDRPGHDRRYAIDATKIQTNLGWYPQYTFEEGIELTINWYLKNKVWLKNVTSGNYKNYYKKHYSS